MIQAICKRRNEVHPDILKYNETQEPSDQELCNLLAREIDQNLPGSENRIWHAHPVWFLDGNPTVGYSKQNPGIRLMFWSGADFEEPGLNVVGKKFKDASVFFKNVSEIKKTDLRRWLKKSLETQWNNKDIVRHRGHLEKMK